MKTKIVRDSLIGAEAQGIKLVYGDLQDARKVMWSSGNVSDFREDNLSNYQVVRGFKIRYPGKDPDGVRLAIWINSRYGAKEILPALGKPLIEIYLMEYLPILLFRKGEKIPEEVEALILGNLYRECSDFLWDILDFPEIDREEKETESKCFINSEIKYEIQFKNLGNNSGEEYFVESENTYHIDLSTELGDNDVVWVLYHEIIHLFRDRWNFFTFEKHEKIRYKMMPELVEYLYRMYYNQIVG